MSKEIDLKNPRSNVPQNRQTGFKERRIEEIKNRQRDKIQAI